LCDSASYLSRDTNLYFFFSPPLFVTVFLPFCFFVLLPLVLEQTSPSVFKSFSLFPPPSPLFMLVFIGGKRERELLLSWHKGSRVARRPLGSHLKAARRVCSLCFFIWGQVRGVGFVGISGLERERKREKIQGSKLLLRLPLRVQGKKKQHRAVQNGIVSCFFFF